MANAVDLTTILKARDWLGLKGAEFDDIIMRMITSFSVAAEAYCSRSFHAANRTIVRDGHGGVKMAMKDFPINSVASVTIDGVLIQPSNYVFSKTSIILTAGAFTKGYSNVTITYNAGYTEIPADLEQAILEWIELRFRRKGSADMISKALAGETTAYSQSDMPSTVKLVLGNYKRVPIL